MTDLVDFNTENLKDQARFTLATNEVDSAAQEDVFSGFITKPFAGLLLFHQQLTYYWKHINLIVNSRANLIHR